jgi:hypothetical protein
VSDDPTQQVLLQNLNTFYSAAKNEAMLEGGGAAAILGVAYWKKSWILGLAGAGVGVYAWRTWLRADALRVQRDAAATTYAYAKGGV